MYPVLIFTAVTVLAVVAIVVSVLGDDDVHPVASSAPRQSPSERAGTAIPPRTDRSAGTEMAARPMVAVERRLAVDAMVAAGFVAAVAILFTRRHHG
jgi:hypothetical protein